ncbi:N-acetyltransferase B complex non catalytic subunit-domain-containing protein [Plectosphaerella plurivora]|uniref:N-acetyltransferase B complex non catalytic subunit-domain-containing protein n=1 Tax=Plectosphaerella plurivora TaxID=936078 RepID=A0A9P8V5B5_9PEZI|nr:N-acetyltransferase B complex non catalytic subunit-domain-containing protein [Plectosphaerella plurivora]
MSWTRPRLKRGVDLQLQTAFDDGQWASVIRLAEKRFRTFNDPYFEVVKICAESQLEGPSEKSAALIALQKYVKEGTVIKDVDAIDLLEWAVGDAQDEGEFPLTFGPLKTRFVKASPKDRNGGVRCLESCLLHWDLVSAQQIAAILDRSFPQERVYFFWNVVITYMLSTSDQCPADKRKLYGTLALKQMQRASQASANSTGGDSDRSVRTEEEVLLLYRILETNGSSDEWQAALEHPQLGPVEQFRRGRKDLFLRALQVCEDRQEWQTAYKLCKDCLLIPGEGEPKANMLACDWVVWDHFLRAASHILSSKPSVIDEVAAVLAAFSAAGAHRPIYLRNILLARVASAFRLGDQENRIEEVKQYIENQCSSPACFDDIKGFVELLDPVEMRQLAHEHVPALAARQKEPLHTAAVKVLAYQLQYLVLTVPGLVVQQPAATPDLKDEWKCIITGTTSESPSCPERFQQVAHSGAALYQALIESIGNSNGHDPDCVPELAILTATALVKVSGFDGTTAAGHTAPLHSAVPGRLLQAALILENQLDRTPKHTRVTLLLVRIYIVLGCVSRAGALWETMDVKRTIIDSLSPYFLDRLATISPSAVVPTPGRPEKSLTYPLRAYYAHSLRMRMPRRLADAFESESLMSILDIPEFMEKLRASCTLVMGHIEELRALRALGQRSKPASNEPLLSDISTRTQLSECIDYGSVPRLDVSTARPIYDLLRIGPGPSNDRSQLSIISERFFEVLLYKQPTSIKAANPLQAASVDHLVVLETLQQLGDSLSKFLHKAHQKLTAQEASFYELIGLLTSVIPLLTAPQGAAPAVAREVFNAIKFSLDGMVVSALSVPDTSAQPIPVLMLGSLHGLSHLRDAAAAVKLTTAYLTTFNDLQRSRDRSGQSCFAKDVLADVKKLEAAAAKTFSDGKARVALLRKEVGNASWESRIRSWAFEGSDELTESLQAAVGGAAEKWARTVAESYQANVKGWELVKWE